MPKEIPTDEGRQGVTGHGVRYVLAFSLGGATVALLFVLFLYVL